MAPSPSRRDGPRRSPSRSTQRELRGFRRGAAFVLPRWSCWGLALAFARRRIGLAAFAGAESRPLGVGMRPVETNVLWIGKAPRTGGATVNPGRLDRVVERAVGGAIARRHRSPSRILLGRKTGGFRCPDMGIHDPYLSMLNSCPKTWCKESPPATRFLRECWLRRRAAPP